MKYFMIFAIALFCCQIANANPPINAGTINISGDMYYRYIKEEDNDNTNYLKFSPGIYYFFITNFSAGVDISYERIWNNENLTEYKVIDPGIRFYLLTGEKIYPFIFSTYRCYWREKSNKNSNYDTQFGIGVDIFISKNIALEPYFAYHMAKRNYEGETYGKYKMYETGVALSLFLFQ